MTGQTLTAANTVSGFTATNSGTGAIQLTDTAALLTVTGVTQSGSGDLTISDSGSLSLTGALTLGSNNINLTTTGTQSEAVQAQSKALS